jgi:hypothetical protein
MAKRGVNRRRRTVRESNWVRVEQTKDGLYVQSSKFLEAGVELSARGFGRLWAGLSPQERLDLCAAYHAKPTITNEDEEILSIIMRKGDDLTWSSIASVLTRHSNRRRVQGFIKSRIAKQAPPLSNFYHAAELLGDSALVPLLAKRHRAYQESAINPETGDRVLSIDYLTCCRTLWKLTGSREYEEMIVKYLSARDKFVSDCAKRLLQRPNVPSVSAGTP